MLCVECGDELDLVSGSVHLRINTVDPGGRAGVARQWDVCWGCAMEAAALATVGNVATRRALVRALVVQLLDEPRPSPDALDDVS